MLFFTVVSALIAAVAAAPNFPVEDSGLSSIFRRSTCSGLPTTTVNDATLTGPFRLRARSTDASLNGNYARAPFNATLACKCRWNMSSTEHTTYSNTRCCLWHPECDAILSERRRQPRHFCRRRTVHSLRAKRSCRSRGCIYRERSRDCHRSKHSTVLHHH